MDEFDITIYQFIGGSLESAVATFVDPVVDSIIADIGPTVLMGVNLYVAVTLCRIVLGLSARPVGDVLAIVVRVAIVSYFALSAERYQDHVVDFFASIEAGLLGAFDGALPGLDASAGIYVTLDSALGKGMMLASECLDRAGDTGWLSDRKWGWIFSGILIFAASIASTIAGAAIALLAKVALGVLIAIGPLFLACLMFPAFGRFFELWASQVFQYTLVAVVVIVILAISITIYVGYLAGVDVVGGGVHPLATAGGIGILAIISLLAMKQSTSIAAGLGGGISLAGVTAREMLAPAAGALRQAGSLANFKLSRRDMRSGMMVRMPAWRHLLAGNTRALNPAYRSYMKEHASSGWGSASGGKAVPVRNG